MKFSSKSKSKKNSNFLTNKCYEISTFDVWLKVPFLTKISIFGQTFIFLVTKIFIYAQTFQYLTKQSIFFTKKMLLKNWLFGQILKCLGINKNFGHQKKWKFGQKLKFWLKMEVLIKHRRLKYWSENANFFSNSISPTSLFPWGFWVHPQIVAQLVFQLLTSLGSVFANVRFQLFFQLHHNSSKATLISPKIRLPKPKKYSWVDL